MVQAMTFRCIGVRRYVVEHPEGHRFWFNLVRDYRLQLKPEGEPAWNVATAPRSREARHALVIAAYALAEMEVQARGELPSG